MSLKRKPPEGNVRRVTSIGQNLRGVITNKMGRIVQFESFAERTLLLVLERDRSVIDYGSQPETFEFVDRYGKARRYTPDFIVWKENGEIEIHEVTRTERRGGTGACEREYAAQKICQARGWRYIVHTEQSLPQQTEVTNLLALVAYRLRDCCLKAREISHSACICKMKWFFLHCVTCFGMENSVQTGTSCSLFGGRLLPTRWSGCRASKERSRIAATSLHEICKADLRFEWLRLA
jgi:hypothetical protein